MTNWRTIRKDILAALDSYTVYNVKYEGPKKDKCSAFFIYLDRNEDAEKAINDLVGVRNQHKLSVDGWCSDNSNNLIIQLNAYEDSL